MEKIFSDLKGAFYGDKGYLTKLKEQFSTQKITLFTKTRANMKKEKLSAQQAQYLKKRGLIETVFDLLTAVCDLEHTRHRSPKNFISNCFAAGSLCSSLLTSPDKASKLLRISQGCE